MPAADVAVKLAEKRIRTNSSPYRTSYARVAAGVMNSPADIETVLRELRETEYQFTRPYVLDSAAITRELGLEPTPWAEVCRATATGTVDEAVSAP